MPSSGDRASDFAPRFFTGSEWAFLIAACERLIPADELGPGAVELNVPEFVDRHMQTPYAAGALWYRVGPFQDAAAEFGYQGALSLRELLRAGIEATDHHCRANYGGRVFADLAVEEQVAMLGMLERGELDLSVVPSSTFFTFLLAEVKAGFFADPRHGGNRDGAAWEMIGYPGMKSDYREWIDVRDRPYDAAFGQAEKAKPAS